VERRVDFAEVAEEREPLPRKLLRFE
jgi:hypothetical protein